MNATKLKNSMSSSGRANLPPRPAAKGKGTAPAAASRGKGKARAPKAKQLPAAPARALPTPPGAGATGATATATAGRRKLPSPTGTVPAAPQPPRPKRGSKARAGGARKQPPRPSSDTAARPDLLNLPPKVRRAVSSCPAPRAARPYPLSARRGRFFYLGETFRIEGIPTMGRFETVGNLAPFSPFLLFFSRLARARQVWQGIAVHLEAADLVRVSMTSRKGYKVAHRISETATGSPIYISEAVVKLEGLATVIEAWSSLSFAYTKKNETAGTFWSEDTNAFINASMLFQCEGLHTLSLVECDDVEDVTPLRKLKNLLLKRCNGVHDVAPLSSIYTLTIERCMRITDVTPLQNVTNLILDRCPKVLDVGQLGRGKLVSLTLRKCRNIRDVSGLGGSNLHTLILDNMHNVEDVSALGTLKRLHVRAPQEPPQPRAPDTRTRTRRTPHRRSNVVHTCGIFYGVAFNAVQCAQRATCSRPPRPRCLLLAADT